MEADQKYRRNDLTSEQKDALFQPLVRAKFDRDRRERWAKTLADQHGVQREKATGRSAVRSLLLALAAAAAIALLLVARPWETVPATNYTALADPYLQAEPFPNVIIRKGPVVESETLRTQMAEAYSKGQYATAITRGQQLLQLQQTDVWDLFYLSLSYLYLDQPEEAILYFDQAEELSRQTSGDFQQEIQWFRALAYVKNAQWDEARTQLMRIGPDDWQYGEAQTLLGRLPE